MGAPTRKARFAGWVLLALLAPGVAGVPAAASAPAPDGSPPDVVGRSPEDARKLIEAEWFPGAVVVLVPDPVPSRVDRALVLVAAQEVTDTGDVDSGASPTVTLTLGTRVPDLGGATLAQAQATSADRLLPLDVSPPDALADWTVEVQDPKPAELVAFDTKLRVALTPPAAPEPDPGDGTGGRAGDRPPGGGDRAEPPPGAGGAPGPPLVLLVAGPSVLLLGGLLVARRRTSRRRRLPSVLVEQRGIATTELRLDHPGAVRRIQVEPHGDQGIQVLEERLR